jgi:hypothetical protein
MGGKAGSQNHNLGRVRDQDIRPGDLYGCTELHFLNNFHTKITINAPFVAILLIIICENEKGGK